MAVAAGTTPIWRLTDVLEVGAEAVEAQTITTDGAESLLVVGDGAVGRTMPELLAVGASGRWAVTGWTDRASSHEWPTSLRCGEKGGGRIGRGKARWFVAFLNGLDFCIEGRTKLVEAPPTGPSIAAELRTNLAG